MNKKYFFLILLSLITLSALQAQNDNVYYFGADELPDALQFLPAPPKKNTTQFLYDSTQYQWGKAQRLNTHRALRAIEQATVDINQMAAIFSDAFGTTISDECTPAIMKVLRRGVLTARQAASGPKNHYMRQRPFDYFNEPTLILSDENELRTNGSYPSGHTVRALTMALLLTEINPEAQNELLRIAYEWGESRVVAGFHWQSDVDAARYIAAGCYARLHADESFLADMAAARVEFKLLKRYSPDNEMLYSGNIHAPENIMPPPLKKGDKIALISPSYSTSMENVNNTAEILKKWGYVPVIGPNVGKIHVGKYAGTEAERLSDLRWALQNPEIKAIICNRGGYGALHLLDKLSPEEFTVSPKWLIGFSDITLLHGIAFKSHVMSIHSTMSNVLGHSGGQDITSTLLRDILEGKIPRYELPYHPQNIKGKASGVLIGGNLCTFVSQISSESDLSQYHDFILFIEEVEESMHNIDRMLTVLDKRGLMSKCRGVVMGSFSDCLAEFDYESIEAMLHSFVKKYNIPFMCGFPAGHIKVNMPLIMGAPVTMEVRGDGSTLRFDIVGTQQTIRTVEYYKPDTTTVQTPVKHPAKPPKKTPKKKKKRRR